MYLIFLAAITAVCAEPYGHRVYLPPAPRPLFRTPAFDESAQEVPAGSYTNAFEGIVVDADSPGSSRLAPGVESALGRPRESYGSTNSKVGEAAFKTTFGAFKDGNLGPGTRIAPGFESIISGSEGGNDFKIGDASYKIAPGFGSDDFLKLSAEEGGIEGVQGAVPNCDHGTYDEKKYNEGNLENTPHNAGPHLGSIHGSIGTINHNTHFSNTFGKPESNQVNKNNQIYNSFVNNQVKNVYRPISTSEIYKESSLSAHSYVSGAPSVTSMFKETGQSSGHSSQSGINSVGRLEGTASTNTKDSSESLISKVVTPNFPSKSGGVITSSVLSGQTETFTGELNRNNNPSIHKESSGYQYKVPTVTFDSQNSNRYSQSEETNFQIIQNGLIVSKPGFASDSTSKKGLLNTQGIHTNSFQSTTQTKPTTNINVENLVTQTTSPLQIHTKFGQTIQPTTVSLTGLETPSTFIVNIQPSEGVLGISTKDIVKSQAQAVTGVVSIIPTKTFTLFNNYESSAQTQTQLPSFNFGRPDEHLHTFGISKPTSPLSPYVTYTGSSSTSYSSHKFSNQSPSSQLSGQVSTLSSVKSVKNDEKEFNTNVNQTSKIFGSQKSTQSNLPGSDKKFSNPVLSQEFSAGSVVTSSMLPSPAPPLNYLIQDTNLEQKGSLSAGVDSNMDTATAFVSSDVVKPEIQNLNGKHTLITAKPTQVQGSDHSYYYNKPLKPLIVPFKQNYGLLDRIQTGNKVTTSKSENTLTQINLKDSIQDTQIQNNNFGQLTQVHSSQNINRPLYTGQNQITIPQSSQIVFEDTQTQFQKTQFAKPSDTENIKESEISQVQSGSYVTKQQNSQTAQTASVSTQTLNTQNKQISGISTQFVKPEVANNHFGSQSDKITFGHTNLGLSQTTINQQNTGKRPLNTSTHVNQQGVEKLYEYNKPVDIIIKDKDANTATGQIRESQITQIGQTLLPVTPTQSLQIETDTKTTQTSNSQKVPTSNYQANSQSEQTNLWTQTFKPQFGQKPQTSTTYTNTQSIQTQVASQPSKFSNQQSTLGIPQNKFGLTQFGAQNFKPSTVGQSQESTGQLYEYKKPTGIAITNTDTYIATGQVSGTQSEVTQVDQTSLPVSQTEKSESVQLQTEAQTTQSLDTQNVPTSSFQTSSQSGQTNVWTQTLNPAFSQKPQTSTTYTNTQSIQSASQPAKFSNEQSTFGSSQSKYGLTQLGAQHFKPSTVGQSQETTGQLYEYKKPTGIVITNTDTNIATGQVSGTQSKVEAQTTQSLDTQNRGTSSSQTSSQSGQTNAWTQTFKPAISQIPQTSTTHTNTQSIQTQVASQPSKFSYEQSTFGSSHNKYGVTQFGAQKFKTPTGQLQQSKGQLYEYKKPLETITTDKEKISQIQSHGTQSSFPIPLINQTKPLQLSITSKTGTSISQNKPVSTIQSGSQFGSAQFGQANLNRQTFKPTFGQITQVNTATTGAQFGIVTKKPQIPLTQFFSQPIKPTFEQSTFGSSQSKYGLTPYGTQKFKPSFTGQAQISSGEPYEYKKVIEATKTNKESSSLIENVRQTQSQVTHIGPTSFPTAQVIQTKPVQQSITSQTGSTSTQSIGVQKQNVSTFQNFQFGRPQIDQGSFGTQLFKPTFGQTSQACISTSTQTAQVVSQPTKLLFGHSTFGSTQNKYGLTQFGAQKFKPATSQLPQSTGQLYEYNKPTEILTNNKDTQNVTSQISDSQSQILHVSETSLPTDLPDQIQSVQMKTGTKTAQIWNIQNKPISVPAYTELGQTSFGTQTLKPAAGQISQTNIDSTNTQTIQGTQIGIASFKPQVSGTQFVSQPAVTTVKQSTFTIDTQNKFEKASEGELYTNKKLTETLELNKGAQLALTELEDKSANKFNNQQVPVNTSGQQYSEELYMYNKPTIAFVTNKDSSPEKGSKISGTQSTGDKTSIETQVVNSQSAVESQGLSAITNHSNVSQHSIDQNEFDSKQMLETASANAELTNVQKEAESTFDKIETTSNINTGVQSAKPELEQNTFEEQVSQTKFEVTPSTLILNKPSVNTISEKETSIINTSQFTQTTQNAKQDSKINEAPITSYIQSTNTQATVNTLGIPLTKPYVSENQIFVGQDKPLEQNKQITSGIVETSASQTEVGVQSTKPACESTQSENIDNNKATFHLTEVTTNQEKFNSNTQNSHNNALRPATEQNSYANTETSSLLEQQQPHFGFAQTQNYHSNFHHQHDHPYPHDHSHFHGHPYHHHDYPNSHDFSNHHGFYHHHRGPVDFNFHNHDFKSQYGYGQNKPYSHFNSGDSGKNQFEQNRFPFSKFGFLNEPHKFQAVKNNLPNPTQHSLIQTQNPSFDQTIQPFGSTIPSFEFTNGHKDMKLSSQPINPTFVTEPANQNQQAILTSTGSKAQNHVSTSTVISAEHSVPFGRPTEHKFVGSFNSDANYKAQTGPSMSVAHASLGPSSIKFTGDSSQNNPQESNAVAKAQSGNAFGQNNFASATATTGPALPEFNIHGGRFQPFSIFNSYGFNAVAKAISGPQFGLNPINSGAPSFSHAFASASKDSSFASSFVSSTPVTTTTFGGSTEDSNFVTKLTTPIFSEVNTAKPIHDKESLTQVGSVGKFDSFGGPREPPRFDRLTGYHY